MANYQKSGLTREELELIVSGAKYDKNGHVILPPECGEDDDIWEELFKEEIQEAEKYRRPDISKREKENP